MIVRERVRVRGWTTLHCPVFDSSVCTPMVFCGNLSWWIPRPWETVHLLLKSETSCDLKIGTWKMHWFCHILPRCCHGVHGIPCSSADEAVPSLDKFVLRVLLSIGWLEWFSKASHDWPYASLWSSRGCEDDFVTFCLRPFKTPLWDIFFEMPVVAHRIYSPNEVFDGAKLRAFWSRVFAVCTQYVSLGNRRLI